MPLHFFRLNPERVIRTRAAHDLLSESLPYAAGDADGSPPPCDLFSPPQPPSSSPFPAPPSAPIQIPPLRRTRRRSRPRPDEPYLRRLGLQHWRRENPRLRRPRCLRPLPLLHRSLRFPLPEAGPDRLPPRLRLPLRLPEGLRSLPPLRGWLPLWASRLRPRPERVESCRRGVARR